MEKEELYKLSLDSCHEYPLLAELMAIRDERFKDEQQDSMLCVNGYVGIDTLNNYVKLQQENQQLKIQISAREEKYKKLEGNWNKLKEHCNVMLSIFEKMNNKDREKQLDKYVIYDKFLSKMQELERGVSDVED